MDIHQHAKATPSGRLLMVRRLADGWSVARVAAAFGVTGKTVRKWRARHAAEGVAGLRDRSSRPHASPTRLDEAAEAEIVRLRHRREPDPAPHWLDRGAPHALPSLPTACLDPAYGFDVSGRA
jgi:transposase-like protein